MGEDKYTIIAFFLSPCNEIQIITGEIKNIYAYTLVIFLCVLLFKKYFCGVKKLLSKKNIKINRIILAYNCAQS